MSALNAVKLELANSLQTAKHVTEVLPVALLMCQLSQQAYEPARLQHNLLGQWQNISTSGPAGLPDQDYRAKLIGSQLAAPEDKLKRQFALWIVPTIGFVAAFRGTADFADVCTDLDFGAESLSSCSGVEIHVHGGMLRGIAETVQSVLDLYQQHKHEWQGLPLYWTGHSLGGGYAICSLLYAISKHPQAATTACADGGVFTFGAPLVLSQQSGAISQRLIADLLPQGCQSVAAGIVMHHYVNNLDIVPRLLGANRLNSLLAHIVGVLPAGAEGRLAQSLSSVIQRAGAFVPFGQYHLVLDASLRSVDAAVDQAALLYTWKQAVEFLTKIVVGNSSAQYALYIQWLQDHFLSNYSLSLKNVAKALTIRLPVGQDPSQVRTVMLQSNDSIGSKLGLGIMCNLNGVKIVMRGAFAERKKWKKALAVGFAGAGGLAVGQNEGHVQGLMQQAAKFFPEQLQNLAQNPAAVAKTGKTVVSGVASAAGALTQAAGSAVVPLLATQLAVGLLNLAVTAYVAHRVHKLDKTIDAFRAETNIKLDLVTSGISNIQAALQDQKAMLTASLNMIDGKLDILISGQQMILEELFSLRGDVQSGVQSVHDHLLAMQDTQFRQDFAQLQEIYCEVLRRIGEPDGADINPHLADLLKDRGRDLERLGRQLQHNLLSRLDAHSDMSCARALAQRQPMILAFCFAALARDVGNSLVISPDHILPERDNHRKLAVAKLDAELAALLRTSTLYELAVDWEGVVTRYVYTRRGLLGGTGFGVANMSEHQQEPTMLYQASDLHWDDGLGLVRQLTTRTERNPKRMKPGFPVNTPSLLAWYNDWRGQQSDDAVSQLPYVTLEQLLQSLGVPAGKMTRIIASLHDSDLPVLRGLVLPSFSHSVDIEFVDQLTGFEYQLLQASHTEDSSVEASR